MNYNFLKVLGLVACLTNFSCLQSVSNKPESVYMNIYFGIFKTLGEFVNNVTNNDMVLILMGVGTLITIRLR